MKNKNYLSISEFARLTGIKRANLIFYDRIGLLIPELRGENEYRYYNRHQLDYAYLISSLRELGIGLTQIKSYAESRTPEAMIELFRQQEAHIRQEINKLEGLHEIMQLHTNAAKSALAIEEEVVFVSQKKEEPILTGSPIKAAETEEDAMTAFYQLLIEKKMAMGYPLGTIVSKDSLVSGGPFAAARFYILAGKECNGVKPAGLYGVIHSRCAAGQAAHVYERLLNHLDAQHLIICGDAYEEYPLSELCIRDPKSYRVKIEVPVHPK